MSSEVPGNRYRLGASLQPLGSQKEHLKNFDVIVPPALSSSFDYVWVPSPYDYLSTAMISDPFLDRSTASKIYMA